MKFKIVILIVLFFGVRLINAQYLSDSDKTYKQIEEFQRDSDDSINYLLTKIGEKYFTKKAAYQLCQQGLNESFLSNPTAISSCKLLFDRYLSGLYPTRYQDPFQYVLYAFSLNNIDSTAKAMDPTNSYSPKFGTFYSNSINAERRTFKEDYLILVHSNYIKFSYQMGKVSLQLLKNLQDFNAIESFLDTNFMKNQIQLDKEMALNFSYTFLEFNYKHFPINDSLLMENVRWLNNGFIQKSLQYWNNANELFVLGHEYSHAMLKHSTGDSDFQTDTVLLKSWMNEIQADSMSQEILNTLIFRNRLDSNQMGWTKYLIMGGLFYLNILDIFENDQMQLNYDRRLPELTKADHDSILTIFNNKNDLSGNLIRFSKINRDFTKLDHPPTSIRIELIKKLVEKKFAQNIYSSNQINLIENLMLKLGFSMLYFLRMMDLELRDGFHNAYLKKDFLNKTYN